MNTDLINEIFNNITKQYSDMNVAIMLDDEIYSGNWIDDDWESDGYSDEYEWYMDHSNGEAEDVIVSNIINTYLNTNNLKLDIDEYSILDDMIRDEYSLR